MIALTLHFAAGVMAVRSVACWRRDTDAACIAATVGIICLGIAETLRRLA